MSRKITHHGQYLFSSQSWAVALPSLPSIVRAFSYKMPPTYPVLWCPFTASAPISLSVAVTSMGLTTLAWRCPPTLYPPEIAFSTPLSCTGTPRPVVVKDKSVALVISVYEAPTSPPINSIPPAPPPSSPMDLSTIFSELSSLAQAISHLLPPPTTTPTTSPMVDPPPSTPPTTNPTPKPIFEPPWLLSTLSHEAIIKLIHRVDVDLQWVCLCDTTNVYDTKMHWTSEVLHCIMGCCMFWNYKHLIQVNRDGDGGVFPPSLGSYATIRKANSSGPVDRTKYEYLDAVHMDITFVLVGGFLYTLILVDQATRYNLVFGLKNLSSHSILSAIQFFQSSAGSLAWCFYCNCDFKLFGTTISK